MASNFKKVAFVYNPNAGKGSAKTTFLTYVQPIIKKEFGSRLHKIVETESSGGYSVALSLIKEGCDLIVACGGDGTNHDIVNAIMGETGEPQCAMAAIPLGTGDDFCRSIGLSQHNTKDLTEKYEYIVKTLASTGRVIEIDVGSVEPTPLSGPKKRHWFLNESSFGFSAEVIRAINEQTSFWISKDFSFQYKSISMAFMYEARKVKLSSFNEKSEKIGEEEDIRQLVAVSNGQYFGAGMQINPGALINDGVLNVCKWTKCSGWNIMWIINNIYNGAHGGHPKVSFDKRSELLAECEHDVFVEADGELVGKLPATCKCNHKKLKFIVPIDCVEAQE